MRVPLGTAAAIAKVPTATIRQWVHRGHINRYPDDGEGEYETTEIVLWLDQTRDQDMTWMAALSYHTQYQEKWIA